MGDLGSGVFGSNSHLTQDKIDRLTEAHKVLSRNKYRYGMRYVNIRSVIVKLIYIKHNHSTAFSRDY